MHTIRDTPKNPAGLCALSVDNEGGYLAYPGNSQVRQIHIPASLLPWGLFSRVMSCTIRIVAWLCLCLCFTVSIFLEWRGSSVWFHQSGECVCTSNMLCQCFWLVGHHQQGVAQTACGTLPMHMCIIPVWTMAVTLLPHRKQWLLFQHTSHLWQPSHLTTLAAD